MRLGLSSYSHWLVLGPRACHRPHTLAPVRDAAAEAMAEPARHGALRGKAELLRDRRKLPAGIFDQLDHELGAASVEDFREGGAACGKVAMDGAAVAGEMLRHTLDRAFAG